MQTNKRHGAATWLMGAQTITPLNAQWQTKKKRAIPARF